MNRWQRLFDRLFPKVLDITAADIAAAAPYCGAANSEEGVGMVGWTCPARQAAIRQFGNATVGRVDVRIIDEDGNESARYDGGDDLEAFTQAFDYGLIELAPIRIRLHRIA